MPNLELSLPTKNQLVGLLKVAIYIGVSAAIDFLISETAGTQFGSLTPFINMALVAAKAFLTKGK